MPHNDPKPATPQPHLEAPDIQDVVASALPHVLTEQPLQEIAASVTEDIVRDLLMQLVSHLTPLGGSDAHYRAGKESYAACKYREALAHFSAALTYDPSNIYSQFERARTQAMLGRPDLAIADYTAIIQREPTYRAAYQNRGINHWTRGDIAAADADFDQAQELATEPGQRTFVNAIRLEMHGQHEAAINAYTTYLITNPDSTYSRYHRAGLYLELKQHDLALEDLAALLYYDSRNLSGLRRRGRLHLDAGRYTEAAEDYRRAVALAPEHAVTHFWLARALQGLREWDAAIGSYLRSLELDPKTYSAHWSLGDIHAECGRPAEAIAAYAAYIDQQPDPEWQARAQRKIDRLRAQPASGAA